MNIKKIITSCAASALAVFTMAVSAFAIEDGEAYIQYEGGDWITSFYNDGQEYASYNDTVKITGDGSYSVTLHAAVAVSDAKTGATKITEGSTDLVYIALAVPGGEKLFPGMVITIDSVEVDGVPIVLKGVPYTSSNDGVETIVNLYNSSVSAIPDDARTIDGDLSKATSKAVNKALGSWKTITVNFTVSGIGNSDEDDVATEIAAAAETVTSDETDEAAESVSNSETSKNTNRAEQNKDIERVPAKSADNTPAPVEKNVNTGVEGSTTLAGAAVLAAAALVIAKKRK